MAERELTQEEIAQIDFIQELSYEVMCNLLGETLEWDIEWVGKVADALVHIASEQFGYYEDALYPYVKEE